MAIMCVIGFLDVSSFDYKLKLIYILVTYVLYEALYTCVNVPFGSLSSVMTDDVNHRTDLSRYRSLGGTIFMTVVVIAGPLVLYKDNNPIPSRFTLMALICATLKHIIKNRALLGLIFSSLAGMIAASVVNGLNTYLFKDYFGNVQIMAVSGMLSTVYSIITFVGTKFVSKKFGKKEWCMYGAGFAAIVFGILFFFPIKNPILFIVINGICYLGASGFQVLIWAMVNDAIDYQELTTGDRKEGMVYATYSFFRKLASAVSSSLSSFTLALIGYNVNEAVQTAAVKAHIWKSYTAIYAIGYLIAVLILYFVYPLSKKKTEEMLETLAKKRAKQGE